MPFIYDIFSFFAIGAFICKMVPFVQCTAVVTEILTMTCIAVERHQGLVYPFKMKRQYTNQRAFTMLGMFVILCHCRKAPELKNLNKSRFIFARYFSLWSLGSVVSGSFGGETEHVMGSIDRAGYFLHAKQEAKGQKAKV